DDAVDAAGVPAVADADAPRASIGVAADGAVFAEIDHGALEAFVAQQVGDDVRDVALGDAVQRDGHAGAREADRLRAVVDPPEIHQRLCNIARARRDVRLDLGPRPEVRLVESPQRLHRNVERAAAQHTEALALLDQGAQLGRRLRQPPRAVEARDFAVGP